MRTAFIDELVALAAEDERIWLLTADLGYSVLERFADRFPRRYVNVGVAEQNMAGMAAGLAMCGKVVFTYSIANFPTLRCLEQIRNDICYHKANVKIVAVGGGLAYGAHGYTHHGVEDLAILRTLPNMRVVAPGDPWEARLATRALVGSSGPCYLRLGKAGEPVVHEAEPPFALGRAIVVRAGRDVTLVSTGATLKMTVEAADQLAAAGIGARVLSMHTLKPIDAEAIVAAARETAGIVSVEEHGRIGGLGSAIADVLVDAGVAAPLRVLALGDAHVGTVGDQSYLRAISGLTAANVVDAARAVVAARPGLRV